MSVRPFAVFDIDGTLIRWQLYHVMVNRLAKHNALDKDALYRLEKARFAWKNRENPDSFNTYEKISIELQESALTKVDPKLFDKIAHEAIEEYKDQTYTYTRDLILRLKADGYFLLIISGSPNEMVGLIAKQYGFDDFTATSYERIDNKFTGKKLVASFDKKLALEQLVAKHSLIYAGSLAIGDSGSDIPMLEMVEQPIAFNPDQVLYDAAIKAEWKIVVERKNVIYELRADSPGNYRLQK
ncbi:MAG: HAD-IB family hydrolase [Candidatus Saccharimonadales bacterium]